MMGEATYNHVFVDASEAGDATRRLALAAGGGDALQPTPTGPSPARTAAPGLDTDDDEPAQVRCCAGIPGLMRMHHTGVEGTDARPLVRKGCYYRCHYAGLVSQQVSGQQTEWSTR